MLIAYMCRFIYIFIIVVASLAPQRVRANACSELFSIVPARDTPLLSKWFVEKHISLANDYRRPDGQYCEHCGTIALNAAELLLKYQLAPEIYALAGKIKEDGNNETLIPLRYGGNVSWGGHQIAVVNGIVYDPLLANPVPFADYARMAFGATTIVVEHVMGATAVQEALARRRRVQ